MRVILADERQEVRSALRLLLEQHPDFEVTGEALEAGDLAALVQQACPDLVLLDWDLPGLRPAEVLPAFRSRCPSLLIVALSGRPELRRPALSAGADAFVSKGDPPERLVAILRQCLDLTPSCGGVKQCPEVESPQKQTA